jgi:hypothetical protein
MEPVVQDFTSWNQLAQNIAFGCWAASILIVLGHLVKLSITKDAKDKYDLYHFGCWMLLLRKFKRS